MRSLSLSTTAGRVDDRVATVAAVDKAAAQAHGARAATAACQALRVEDVYEAHVDFVWRSARSLGAREPHLDDVVQEVFVVVQRRLPDFEGRSELKTWLFGITRRVVRAHQRQLQRNQTQAEPASSLADTRAASPEAQLATLEGTRLLYALLDELDPDLREVFVLAELEEISGPGIAEALDLPLSNVYARVRRARLAFEAALQRHRARASRRA